MYMYVVHEFSHNSVEFKQDGPGHPICLDLYSQTAWSFQPKF